MISLGRERNNAYSLKLLTLREFLDLFNTVAYKGRALVDAFNFPFDAARIACGFGNAKGRYLGGFSLDLFSYRHASGDMRTHPFRFRIAIKQIDIKRALKRFTGRREPDEEDLISEGSTTGKPEDRYVFGGHILDARTLAFALTDRGMSLDDACELFNVGRPCGSFRPESVRTWNRSRGCSRLGELLNCESAPPFTIGSYFFRIVRGRSDSR